MPLAILVCGALGLVVERGLIRPLYRRPFDTLVATWGLSLLLRKIAEAIFGLGYKSLDMPVAGTIHVFGAEYPTYRLILILCCSAALAALLVWYRTAARARASRPWWETRSSPKPMAFR